MLASNTIAAAENFQPEHFFSEKAQIINMTEKKKGSRKPKEDQFLPINPALGDYSAAKSLKDPHFLSHHDD